MKDRIFQKKRERNTPKREEKNKAHNYSSHPIFRLLNIKYLCFFLIKNQVKEYDYKKLTQERNQLFSYER